MEKIESFKINHILLDRGLYVSRRDYGKDGSIIATTFDIRLKKPNREPVINIAEMHTMEHLGATFLRNHESYKNEIIYFGPMGCRTGFYLILKGDLTSRDAVPIVTEMFAFMADFEGEIPGADAFSCGNYLDQNLPMAKLEAKKFLSETLENIGDSQLNYPEG
ncbi:MULTISPECIES: S-ribosylhomocysteine lyase [unclassified Ruminococcus]|uniref:S-ribosylhomocysteine lyase n=1 Tax=unclassified Ruminococcus TaxID=2608920 RepID=UPI00210C1395|nr:MULTISPECIES: S-ribosylhomocysteine lyase [unclassified Ruminococcus]MCQ4021788.1 S-ribosylhomocysteine lyase [Ruminococcus sp. zg-924]MCQ4114232.1 S-ribosylhomocysteine lyase [Ruminococcus sp. zg-921]